MSSPGNQGLKSPRRIRPLPALWIHRTPQRTYEGPLTASDPADEPTAASARPPQPSHRQNLLHVLWVLTRTDFRARYRAQALGIIWSLLNPLVMMGIISIIFTQLFRSTQRFFPVFLLIGLLVWQWVTNAISTATQAFVSNADIVKRTIFARQLLPMAKVLSYGINFCIESMALLAFIPIFPGAFRLSWALLLLPVLLLWLIALLTGIALATSVLDVIYRDVAYIVNTALLLLYWLTPVFYPIEVIPYPYRVLLQCNPIAGILTGLRRVIMDGQAPTLLGWGSIVIPTLLLVGLGWLTFRHYEHMALDYV